MPDVKRALWTAFLVFWLGWAVAGMVRSVHATTAFPIATYTFSVVMLVIAVRSSIQNLRAEREVRATLRDMTRKRDEAHQRILARRAEAENERYRADPAAYLRDIEREDDMGDHVTDEDNRMRAEHGIAVQPDPEPNQLPSAHDLVEQALTETLVDTERLKRMRGDLVEMYAVLCGGRSRAIDEMRKRKAFGLQKYGTLLQPRNNRDHLADAIDEMGDLLVYLECELYERGRLDNAPSSGV